jgi:phosphoglycolate phosphatase-like HAD superfamily hydrolase
LAAQANGIRSIAVATGLTAEEELRKLRPEILLKDLRELRVGMVENTGGKTTGAT